MSTCKNCKWWAREFEECDFINTIHADKYEDSKIEIYAEAWDDSGLTTRLITGPNFGCIKFEGKHNG